MSTLARPPRRGASRSSLGEDEPSKRRRVHVNRSHACDEPGVDYRAASSGIGARTAVSGRTLATSPAAATGLLRRAPSRGTNARTAVSGRTRATSRGASTRPLQLAPSRGTRPRIAASGLTRATNPGASTGLRRQATS
ncbi:hypothetical protein T492DRAFT_928513 [Pavlovales sp. CCMP2436]|nr:hypothetical protein T492DRAFT_928513 [Pavlovales sp. CCMP2436]